MKPVLGNVIALADEARSILGHRNWRRTDRWTILEKSLYGGTRFISVQSGMGLENATAAAKWLVSQNVSALAVVGVSGGLNPDLNVGDIVLADDIMEEKDTTIRDVWKTDKACTDLAFDSLHNEGFTVYRGTILSAARPLFTKDQKTAVFRKSNALAVDMESSAIARVSKDAKRPLVVMRAVCDSAEKTVPKAFFDSMDSYGTIRWLKLLGMLIRSPFLFNDLVDRGREFRSALRTLKKGWQLLVENKLPGSLVSR
jgi:nucleoside phosphorylase